MRYNFFFERYILSLIENEALAQMHIKLQRVIWKYFFIGVGNMRENTNKPPNS